ncbi:MAG: hypothetical protein M4579_004272 [Chaenotheca gracillima]|nr:MAG: hypothetical protein M4579_004272 [Chaenotheca gracillima]
MNDQAQSAASLLTEHFRWTPLSLLDDIINSINALLYHAVSAVENGLLNAPPASLGFRPSQSSNENKKRASSEQRNGSTGEENGDIDEEAMYMHAKEEIENGVHQLETLLEATVDKNFDKLELYALRNVLAVPDDLAPWMRLGHYEGLNFTVDDAQDTPTRESVDQQRCKLRETQKLQLALLQETTRNDALITQLRSLLTPPSQVSSSTPSSTPSPFAFLTSHPSASSHSLHPPTSAGQHNSEAAQQTRAPLTTTTSFTLAQLPSLRTLLATLRPKIASWSTSPGAKQGESSQSDENAADIRTAYVERQVKQHLTSTRGLELDEQGAPREGEGYGAFGRRVGEKEVANLERLVDILGGTSQRRVDGGEVEEGKMER